MYNQKSSASEDKSSSSNDEKKKSKPKSKQKVKNDNDEEVDDEPVDLDSLISDPETIEKINEDYELLKEQMEIVDHLKELEQGLLKNSDNKNSKVASKDRFYSDDEADDLNNDYLDKKKPKVVFETPKGYLDSFMKPINQHKLSEEFLSKKSSTKKTTTISSSKSNIKFHGNLV
jgi:hypothetical protein